MKLVLILQVEDEMEYDILQKVALSKCEDKAGFLIDKMMQVRHKACRHNYNWYKCSVISEDLTSQEKDISADISLLISYKIGCKLQNTRI